MAQKRGGYESFSPLLSQATLKSYAKVQAFKSVLDLAAIKQRCEGAVQSNFLSDYQFSAIWLVSNGQKNMQNLIRVALK